MHSLAAYPMNAGAKNAHFCIYYRIMSVLLQGISYLYIHAPGFQLNHDLESICFYLFLSFFVSSCLTLWKWGFYYLPQHRVFDRTELLGTISTCVIFFLIILLKFPEVALCAGPGEGPSSTESDSENWQKYLNCSSSTEGNAADRPPDQSTSSTGARPQGDGGAPTIDSESPDASRKRKADPGDGEGPSSVRRKVASESEPSPSHANRELPPVDQTSLNSLKDILTAHERIADRIQDLCRELHTRVPGGFQRERLTILLEERHGGDKMTEILHSLQTEGCQSHYFQEVLSDFQDFRRNGVTEQTLRKKWQGRG